MKLCGKCGAEKASTEFHKASARIDGLQCYCKGCQRKDLADRYDSEKDSARVKAAYNADPEKFRAAKRAAHAANPGQNVSKVRAWRSHNHDKCLAQSQRRHARKLGATIGQIAPDFFASALEAWGHRCAYCRADLRAPSAKLEWDHFVPLARGGAHAEHNLVPSCGSCNHHKHAAFPFAFLFDIEYVADVKHIS